MNRDLSLAPETWKPARRVAESVLRPIERFLHVEEASGILLLAAAMAALLWANSPWAAGYEALWHTSLTLGIGELVVRPSLHFLINDGLMTIFFLVVGLEIRREIDHGELSDLRRAALPITAALGGMLAPALIYLMFNGQGTARAGFGVPTATDIAFAVGVLALLGKRVPPALRVLLLALAIIDDIGAILLIAIFYSGGLNWSGFLLVLVGVLLVLLLRIMGVRRAPLYVPAGAIVWLGFLQAGVHPTIAGVVLGVMTPVRSWFGEEGFVRVAGEAVDAVRLRTQGQTEAGLLEPLARVRRAQREVLPPVLRIQSALHPWVAFLIMPLFALANAGVNMSGMDLTDGLARRAALGVFAGLVLGKPLGILLMSGLFVRLGLCALPRGVSWLSIALVGLVAGIGFTMAIFIAGLAFPDPATLAAVKIGILGASFTAAVMGTVVGVVSLPSTYDTEAAQSAAEAERSTAN